MSDEQTEAGAVADASCYRHAGRETYIRCQRCERPSALTACVRPRSASSAPTASMRARGPPARQERRTAGSDRAARAVTLTLIGINLVVFVIVAVSGGADGSCSHAGADPGGRGLLGGWQPTVVDRRRRRRLWQLLTSMFTHVELWHIGFNMLALYVLGPQLETMLGRARFLALYLLSGLVGSATRLLAGRRALGDGGRLGRPVRAHGCAARRGRQGPGRRAGAARARGINVVITVGARVHLVAGTPRRFRRRSGARPGPGLRAAPATVPRGRSPGCRWSGCCRSPRWWLRTLALN